MVCVWDVSVSGYAGCGTEETISLSLWSLPLVLIVTDVCLRAMSKNHILSENVCLLALIAKNVEAALHDNCFFSNLSLQ